MPDDLKNFLETTALKDRLDALKATTPSQRQMLAGNFQTTPPPPSPSSRRLVYSIPQAGTSAARLRAHSLAIDSRRED